VKIGYGLNCPEITAGWAGNSWLPFTKRFRKIRLESKMNHAFLGHTGRTPGAAEHLERCFQVFPYGMFLTEIRVPSLKSHVWYQFQAFAADFRCMELIRTNGKRNSGTTFTSPEFYLSFTQNVNRPVWQVNGKQPLIFSTY